MKEADGVETKTVEKNIYQQLWALRSSQASTKAQYCRQEAGVCAGYKHSLQSWDAWAQVLALSLKSPWDIYSLALALIIVIHRMEIIRVLSQSKAADSLS